MFTRDLTIELAPLGITINNIAPGAIETPINKNLLNDPAKLNRLLENIPLNRLGNRGDVAGFAAFLASEDSELHDRHHRLRRRRPDLELLRAMIQLTGLQPGLKICHPERKRGICFSKWPKQKLNHQQPIGEKMSAQQSPIKLVIADVDGTFVTKEKSSPNAPSTPSIKWGPRHPASPSPAAARPKAWPCSSTR